MTATLFRKQAINHQRERLYGALILAQPVTYLALSALLVFSSAALLIFMISADYIKKERATGTIVPETGMVAVFSSKTGILTHLNVNEGKYVEKGDELFRVTVDQRTTEGKYIGLKLIEELNEQKKYLNRQLELERKRISTQIAAQKSKANELKKEIEHMKESVSNQKKNLALELTAYERAQIMFSEGFVSSAELENHQKRYLDKKQHVQTLVIKTEETVNRLKEIPRYIKELEVISEKEILKIENQFSELTKQHARIEGQRQFTLEAPVAGQITSVTVNVGQRVSPTSPLFSIIPENTRLQVNLYLPARSIGFLKDGQVINIRYAAFPYQKFGTYPGKIKEISKSVILPGNTNSGLSFKEPVYKVTAELKKQHIQAYGRNIQLKPGMTLSADVILDKRSIFEWLLEPLYSLRGRM